MGLADWANKKAAVRGFFGALGSFSFFSRLRFLILPSATAAAASTWLEALTTWEMPVAAVVAASMAALAVAVMLAGSWSLSRSPSSPARMDEVCCMYARRRSLRPVWTWVRPVCRLVRDKMTCRNASVWIVALRGCLPGSRRRGDQHGVQETRGHGGCDALWALSVRVLGCAGDCDELRQVATRNQAHYGHAKAMRKPNKKRKQRARAQRQQQEQEQEHTESLVRVYCSIETISSPVSSFLFRGAMANKRTTGDNRDVVLGGGGGDGGRWWEWVSG